ncbi:chemotaxis protein MotA [Limimonas halophila]|uniref:Chemotaxis protein MotA n=1 Tax=Limimonas halophila TaxID=1082479 RepID=A0A1G7R7Q8_9PROT|nr:flagellar motor stator protein MotA [Limimonas halophila]SDG06788.1 chemotaxis protein MotA [Limimonas halophila]
MLPLVGIGVVLVCVFGGYIMAGGKIQVVLEALPFEFMIIGGAATGALITGNSLPVAKRAAGGFLKVVRGAKWGKKDYTNLLCLLFQLARLQKQKGNLAIEGHVEQPSESSIFTNYPRVMKDEEAVTLTADTLRMLTLDMDNPHHVEDYIDARLEKQHKEHLQPAHSLALIADALPALGIVAAVLGVIKTMASIDQPPEVLGHLIASALVGTFLGVFLSYGIVGPIANRLKQIYEEEHKFYHVIRDVIINMANGYAPQVAVEVGRGNIPGHLQPSFHEVDEAVNELPRETS